MQQTEGLTASELCNALLKEFGEAIEAEGPVITSETSNCIGLGDEDFGLNTTAVLHRTITEAVSEFYQKKGYETVIHGQSVHLKENRRVVKYVVITSTSRNGIFGFSEHFEISVKSHIK